MRGELRGDGVTTLRVRPEDPLDVDEARRLVAEVDALPAGIRVHLDLSSVREVHPTGLAFLAYALDRGGRVTLGGLSRRQETLLRYLLAERSAPGAPAPTAA